MWITVGKYFNYIYNIETGLDLTVVTLGDNSIDNVRRKIEK